MVIPGPAVLIVTQRLAFRTYRKHPASRRIPRLTVIAAYLARPGSTGDGAARSEGVHLGHMAHEPRRSQRLVVWLIGMQAANAAFDAIALYPIGQSTRLGKRAKQWAKDDLDHLGFPERFRFVFPIVKAGSVGGLLLGLRWRALGRLTGAAVVTYFLAALGFHARAKDPALKYVPAVGMLGWSSLALRSMTSRRASR